jgi:hypothetical protein
MNSRRVWYIWRKVLSDKAYQNFLLSGDFLKIETNSEDLAILEQYYAQKVMLKMSIETYDFRLMNSQIHALEICAPLTRRLLENIGNIEIFVKDFLDKYGWDDNGPFVYKRALKMLCFFEKNKKLNAVKGFKDIILVEKMAIELVLNKSEEEISNIYFSKTNIMPWLSDVKNIGLNDLEEESICIKVMINNSSDRYKLKISKINEFV